MTFNDFVGVINPMTVTGNAMFDYFFTYIVFFGVISFIIGSVVKTISRS
jgi:general stress protein CsbA